MKRILTICLFITSMMTLNLYAKKESKETKENNVILDTIKLYDKSREREIPIAIYKSKNDTIITKKDIVIFSHGYGKNYPKNYLNYSYLTETLASNGYFVVSIQHELPNDSLLPVSGNIQVERKPFWDRGVENINYVIEELKKTNPNLDYSNVILIGHSNGGDMSALYQQKYPDSLSKIITLDNRRMLLPRTNKPKIYSLRSSDQPADERVLPSEQEAKQYDMKVVKFENITHNQMNNEANEEQRKLLLEYILKYMNE